MKIHIDNVNLASRTGPNSFAKRLSDALINMGHHVLFERGEDADVSLVFIERSGRPLAKRVVQRLDGIWFSPSEFETKNSGIKHLYETADYVVWQSNFDREMTSRHWGVPSKGSVVKNGVPSYAIENENIKHQLEILKKNHEVIFVSSANWHPQKRLDVNIRVFEHLKKLYPSACLIIMGSNAQPINIKDTYWPGSLPHEICMQIYRESDWMIHTAWLDHCPNTVVEALSCGVPVICSEDGGTKELVGDYGIVLKEIEPYDFSLADYNKPPHIDIENQLEGHLPSKINLGGLSNVDISIEQCAQSYLDVFKKID